VKPRTPGRRRALVVAGVLSVGCLAGAAWGVLPAAERVTDAVADSNRAAGRSEALRLDLSLRIGGGDPIATGQLVTHPTGMARLELVKPGEFVERHTLQGTEHLAARNGRPVDGPRPFLPPLFLLQATSAVSLEAALRQQGVEVEALGIAPCGESDCYVVGDPALVPPPPPSEVLAEKVEGEEATALEGAPEGGLEPAPEPPPRAREPQEQEEDDDRPRATVWIDVDGYEVRRLQSAEGVRVLLGPAASFDKLRVPAWLEIREPTHVPVTLEVIRAAAVNAPANAFGREWLYATPPPGGGEMESASPGS